MSLALEMFAVAPAVGPRKPVRAAAPLARRQGALDPRRLRGRRCRPSRPSSSPAPPGTALQAERRQREDRLRAHWVATLFRLVGRDGKPPPLTVRTSTDAAIAGLMPARTGLPAPRSEAEAVDPQHAARPRHRRRLRVLRRRADDAIVIVQAMAAGRDRAVPVARCADRRIGPAPVPNGDIPLVARRRAAQRDARPRRRAATCASPPRSTAARSTFLSARPYQASAAAELEAATDRVERGTWTEQQAVASVSPDRLQALLHPSLTRRPRRRRRSPPASASRPAPPAAYIVFTAEDAARCKARGRHCILVVNETGPADIDGMKAATGILTARGGMTSHAGVIARITGKPCVAGVRTLSASIPPTCRCRIGDIVLRAGDRITIDGSDGSVYLGALPLSQPHIGGALGELLGWSDATRTHRSARQRRNRRGGHAPR